MLRQKLRSAQQKLTRLTHQKQNLAGTCEDQAAWIAELTAQRDLLYHEKQQNQEIIQRLRKQQKETEQTLQREINDLRSQLIDRAETLEKTQSDYQQQKTQQQSLLEKLSRMEKDWASVLEENLQLRHENQSLHEREKILNQRLEAAAEIIEEEKDDARRQTSALEQARRQIESLQEARRQADADLRTAKAAAQQWEHQAARLEQAETHYRKAQTEIESLRQSCQAAETQIKTIQEKLDISVRNEQDFRLRIAQKDEQIEALETQLARFRNDRITDPKESVEKRTPVHTQRAKMLHKNLAQSFTRPATPPEAEGEAPSDTQKQSLHRKLSILGGSS